jgi:hypothetical protein
VRADSTTRNHQSCVNDGAQLSSMQSKTSTRKRTLRPASSSSSDESTDGDTELDEATTTSTTIAAAATTPRATASTTPNTPTGTRTTTTAAAAATTTKTTGKVKGPRKKKKNQSASSLSLSQQSSVAQGDADFFWICHVDAINTVQKKIHVTWWDKTQGDKVWSEAVYGKGWVMKSNKRVWNTEELSLEDDSGVMLFNVKLTKKNKLSRSDVGRIRQIQLELK